MHEARGTVEANLYHTWEHAPHPPATLPPSVLAVDPASPLYQSDEKRFVTVTETPNDRMDEEEKRIRQARQQARLENVRKHEAVIQDLLKDRDHYDGKKDATKLTQFRRERQEYEKAIERIRARDRLLGPIKGGRPDPSVGAFSSQGAAECLAPAESRADAEDQEQAHRRVRASSGSGVASCLDHVRGAAEVAEERKQRQIRQAMKPSHGNDEDHVTSIFGGGSNQ